MISGCRSAVVMGSSQTTQLPLVETSTGIYGSDPIIIATLRLNTEKYKNPCVKLDFTTNFHALGITEGSIKLQFYKQFDNQQEAIPVGAPWLFSPMRDMYVPISTFVADCDMSCCSNKACCNYMIEASAREFAIAEMGYASFINATLAATLTYTEDCGCNR